MNSNSADPRICFRLPPWLAGEWKRFDDPAFGRIGALDAPPCSGSDARGESLLPTDKLSYLDWWRTNTGTFDTLLGAANSGAESTK
jgi:hypothetical protein